MADTTHNTCWRLSRGKSPFRIPTLRENKDYIVGICLLLVVVFLWTSSAFVTQVCMLCFAGSVRRVELTKFQALFDGGYEKPFL